MVQFYGLLMVLSAVPLFAYLLDGYYQNKMSKGINYIGVFLLIIVIAALLLIAFKLQFVFVLPLVIFALAIIFRSKKV